MDPLPLIVVVMDSISAATLPLILTVLPALMFTLFAFCSTSALLLIFTDCVPVVVYCFVVYSIESFPSTVIFLPSTDISLPFIFIVPSLCNSMVALPQEMSISSDDLNVAFPEPSMKILVLPGSANVTLPFESSSFSELPLRVVRLLQLLPLPPPPPVDPLNRLPMT